MPIIPSGIPQGLANLIQTNMLSRVLKESLNAEARYRADAVPDLLAPATGQTKTWNRLGKFDVDLRPAAPVGAVSRGSYTAEQFTANPRPYAKSFDIDAPTAYVQSGDYTMQGLTRLGAWAGLTSSRIARSKLFQYCGGQTVIRRAQIINDTVLLVDSCAGFRFAYVNGQPTPVSAASPLAITIVAASTFAASVTGVTALDPDFLDGPGQLTISAGLSAVVAAQSYVYATGAAPFIVRPNARASTEALTATDIPTLTDILKMKAKLRDQGIPAHQVDGTYHLHVDAWFFQMVTQDTAWRQAFQTQGMSPIFGAGSMFSPGLGLTIIENNDSPANGKGKTLSVGSATASVGAVGSPGSAIQLQDNGIPVVNSSGVIVRRAIMTGYEVLVESYIDEMQYIAMMGGTQIAQISANLATYQIGAQMVVAGNVDRWRILIRPPVDERSLVATVTVSNTFDFVLSSDSFAISDSSDARPLKRAVVLEHGALY